MTNRIPAALLIALVAAFGCAKNETSSTDSASSATTTQSTASDTSATTTLAANTTAAGGGTVSNLSDADKVFIMKAAQGGMAEVAGGHTASANAASADVRTFGNRMVTDHGKANEELRELATNKGISLPTELDAEHKKHLDEIGTKTASDFDKAYMADMVKDHQEDVAEFQKQSTAAQDPDLKNWVNKTLPTLQEHLKMAQQIHAKLK